MPRGPVRLAKCPSGRRRGAWYGLWWCRCAVVRAQASCSLSKSEEERRVGCLLILLLFFLRRRNRHVRLLREQLRLLLLLDGEAPLRVDLGRHGRAVRLRFGRGREAEADVDVGHLLAHGDRDGTRPLHRLGVNRRLGPDARAARARAQYPQLLPRLLDHVLADLAARLLRVRVLHRRLVVATLLVLVLLRQGLAPSVRHDVNLCMHPRAQLAELTVHGLLLLLHGHHVLLLRVLVGLHQTLQR
mmetsp:Transcript_29541/g.68589  ORF Transcript_29541/g.68589 Transcript_29541/m.68589 type:complete len:244 (-) Transcript_29541:837-1568(-)